MRGAVMRAIKRVLEDVNAAVIKVCKMSAVALHCLRLGLPLMTDDLPAQQLLNKFFLKGLRSAWPYRESPFKAALTAPPDPSMLRHASSSTPPPLQIKAGMAKGKSLETMMRELCGTFEEQVRGRS